MRPEGLQATLAPRASLLPKALVSRFVHVIGVTLAILCASLVAWGRLDFWNAPEPTNHLVLFCVIAHFGVSILAPKLNRYPATHTIASILLSGLLTASALLILVALFRLYYSRALFLTFFPLSIGTHILAAIAQASAIKPIGIVPGGISTALARVGEPRWQLLHRPVPPTTLSGVIADLHGHLDEHWKQFLAACALSNVPIYHSAAAFEMATGRVSLAHHSLEHLAAAANRPIYSAIKPLLEKAIILLTSPLWLLLGFAVAIAIKLDSPGPVFFVQERIGLRGRPFRMIKFRSMRVDSETNGPQFASHDDHRITRVGRFIRQYRLDEIPQMLNVLRGEMSLIGPRPEQKKFVEEFSRELPSYPLRHLVRPGITGWAQVMQGYADDLHSTRVKLEHDLFYIKHMSPWLDLLIIWKTIKTVLSGFGAR